MREKEIEIEIEIEREFEVGRERELHLYLILSSSLQFPNFGSQYKGSKVFCLKKKENLI